MSIDQRVKDIKIEATGKLNIQGTSVLHNSFETLLEILQNRFYLTYYNYLSLFR